MMDNVADIQVMVYPGNNKVIALPAFINSPNVQIKINGINNIITIGSDIIAHDFIIDINGDNATIQIGASCKISGSILCGSHSSVVVGDHFKCNHPVNFRAFEQSSIHIGNHCLFANVYVETSDYHTIFDLETKLPINRGKSIVIGDRVWCARNVIIAKGTVLGNDVVVGAGSFVNKKFGDNILIAGCPAKVKKTNIVWTERRGATRMPEELGTLSHI